MEVLFMDLAVLKRKISSYRTPKGRITNLPNELLGEILHSWEQWTGPSSGFYSAIGADHRKMASLIGKAKQLKRDGAFDGLSFTEVVVEGDAEVDTTNCSPSSGCSIELVYKSNVIRFGNSDLLLDFLKKAA
jgi:hypothetical protein